MRILKFGFGFVLFFHFATTFNGFIFHVPALSEVKVDFEYDFHVPELIVIITDEFNPYNTSHSVHLDNAVERITTVRLQKSTKAIIRVRFLLIYGFVITHAVTDMHDFSDHCAIGHYSVLLLSSYRTGQIHGKCAWKLHRNGDVPIFTRRFLLLRPGGCLPHFVIAMQGRTRSRTRRMLVSE